MAASDARAEGLSMAATDVDRFLAEAVDRCEGKTLIVRDLGKRFVLRFWDAPDGSECRSAQPLVPGEEVFVSKVVLSSDGSRVVGQTDYLDEHSSVMWVNVRSRVNADGLLRPTWYVLPAQRRRHRPRA